MKTTRRDENGKQLGITTTKNLRNKPLEQIKNRLIDSISLFFFCSRGLFRNFVVVVMPSCFRFSSDVPFCAPTRTVFNHSPQSRFATHKHKTENLVPQFKFLRETARETALSECFWVGGSANGSRSEVFFNPILVSKPTGKMPQILWCVPVPGLKCHVFLKHFWMPEGAKIANGFWLCEAPRGVSAIENFWKYVFFIFKKFWTQIAIFDATLQ